MKHRVFGNETFEASGSETNTAAFSTEIKHPTHCSSFASTSIVGKQRAVPLFYISKRIALALLAAGGLPRPTSPSTRTFCVWSIAAPAPTALKRYSVSNSPILQMSTHRTEQPTCCAQHTMDMVANCNSSVQVRATSR
jgi:hypothetical protein